MVKPEDTPAPQTPYVAPQWGHAQMAIDPALQQQSPATPSPYGHYQYAHYPGNYTPGQYPQYAAAAAHPQAAPAAAPAPAASSSRQDNTDVDALKDALGSAGVDLRAEEESLHRSHDTPQAYRQYDDRTRKQPTRPAFDARFLGATMRALAAQHKVARVPEDAVTYLALALRARLQDLLVAMTAAAAHRADAHFDKPAALYPDGTPMWGLLVRADVGRQLAALERVEREDEQRARRARKERADAQAAAAQLASAAAAGAGGGADDEDGGPRKKKRKDGPGIAAKNMSEEVRKKMSNAAANHAAGLGTTKYSWMTAAPPGGASKAKAAAGTPGASPAPPPPPAASSWARPYVSTTKTTAPSAEPEDPRRRITMRDALFVVEKERGHGAGRGAARGWV